MGMHCHILDVPPPNRDRASPSSDDMLAAESTFDTTPLLMFDIRIYEGRKKGKKSIRQHYESHMLFLENKVSLQTRTCNNWETQL